jgi:uncharacterized protein (UPF0332 family)
MSVAPFNWNEYFTLAQDLAARPDEASLRSAISRAYYYVYHLALARASANTFVPKRGEATHVQLWRLYRTSPVPDCQRLALIAEELQGKREKADYEDYYVRLIEEVPKLLSQAQKFEAMLATLPMRHPDPKSVRQ